MEYVIFSNESGCRIDTIYEDADLFFEVGEYTDETKQEAKEEGYKFAHIFELKEVDYADINYYQYVTSVIL
jgi:hypothetical protein